MIFLGKLIGGIFIAFWVVMLGIYISPYWYFGLLGLVFLSLSGQAVVIAGGILFAMFA